MSICPSMYVLVVCIRPYLRVTVPTTMLFHMQNETTHVAFEIWSRLPRFFSKHVCTMLTRKTESESKFMVSTSWAKIIKIEKWRNRKGEREGVINVNINMVYTCMFKPPKKVIKKKQLQKNIVSSLMKHYLNNWIHSCQCMCQKTS